MRAGIPGWPLVLAVLLLGACAADDSQAPPPAPPRATAPAPQAPPAAPDAPIAPTEPASPAAPPSAATRPAPSPADFQWPDPLPAPADTVPTLFKGLVIGSWEPDAEQGFDKEWIDERGVREAWTKSSASRRTWKGFATGAPAVPVDSLLDDREGPAVGYVFSLVARADGDPAVEDAAAVLHVRHRGRLEVFVDGLPAIEAPAPAPGTWGEARAPIVLAGPYTVVLLKLGRGSAALGESMDVEVRVSAPDGSPLPRQTWNTMRPARDGAGG